MFSYCTTGCTLEVFDDASSPPEIVFLKREDARHPSPQRKQRGFMDKISASASIFSTASSGPWRSAIVPSIGRDTGAIERSWMDETELVSLRGCSKALFHKDEENSGN